MLEELETTVNGNIASTTVSHFSKYILLNKKSFDRVWEKDFKVPIIGDSNLPLDVTFVIDYSASMESNDSNKVTKTVTKLFIDRLRENDRASVITFIARADKLIDLTSNKEDLHKVVDKISWDSGFNQYSGTDGSYGIKLALDNLTQEARESHKLIIFLTDGEDNEHSYSYDNLINTANQNNIAIFTVGLGSKLNHELLKKIASSTNSNYYHATNAESLLSVYDSVLEDISFEDTDNDGLWDYYEINGMRLGNGDIIYTNPKEADTDGDGLSDGKELERVFSSDGKSIIYFKYISDPTNPDTDRDGFNDSLDRTPLESITYKNIDYYLEKNHKNKSTIIFLVKTPKIGSRMVIDINSSVGHTFLRIDNNKKKGMYRGFHPGLKLNSKDIALRNTVIGSVHTETGYTLTGLGLIPDKPIPYHLAIDNEKHSPWSIAKVYNVNDKQIDKLLLFTDYYNRKYNIITNNCTTFAVEALNRAGIPSPTEIAQWQIPNSAKKIAEDKIKIKWVVNQLEANLKGYSPADAAQDIIESNTEYLLYLKDANNNMPGLKVADTKGNH